MNGILLDLDALDAQARDEQSKEAYQLVSGGRDYRLGVVDIIPPDGEPVHTIELLVCLFEGHDELQLWQMERTIRLTRELKDRGYLLLHEDDGWISCGRVLPRDEVAVECGALMDIIMEFGVDRQKIEREPRGDDEEVIDIEQGPLSNREIPPPKKPSYGPHYG